MSDFPLHTRASAPPASRPFLEQAGGSLGYVPALLAQMAESPALIEGYATLMLIFRRSTLTTPEQQLALLAVAVELDSPYCTPFEATRARAHRLDEAVITAVRARRRLSERRQEALRAFAAALAASRGKVDAAALARFLAAGFSRANVLELVLAVGVKTLAAHAAQLCQTPPEPAALGTALAAGRAPA